MKAIAATAGLALASGTALGDDRYEGDGDYDFAPVVNVEPVRHQIRVSEPVRECWQETSYAPDRPFSSNHVGATLLGSAIGIALGNQIGHGRGKDVARVAGAVIGGAIGHNVSVDRERYDPGERIRVRVAVTPT
jgi:uncharacterized protein YcfJ